MSSSYGKLVEWTIISATANGFKDKVILIISLSTVYSRFPSLLIITLLSRWLTWYSDLEGHGNFLRPWLLHLSITIKIHEGIQRDTSVDYPGSRCILPCPHCVTTSLTSPNDQGAIIQNAPSLACWSPGTRSSK